MKKILIINGNPKEELQNFDSYCKALADALDSMGNDIRLFRLRDKKIGDCIGCYACWLKTPGICALKDDQEEILKTYLWADFILLASPVMMGFVSAALKTMNDRLLPLVHPFLKLEKDRMGHYQRYDRDFLTGLLLDNKDHLDGDDLEIIRKVYSRSAFLKTMNQSIEEVAYEIDNL
ncbi:flavodoxin family protein [Sinanaerobacter chloroacetimidivorans]|uniref:Flavodoxin family protein n=1 Tax=Sinanaerobacter chloroacetimidivorans TaxID=2818044 RepID=A0A8J8B539_9FIRM|nr:flavodoxin family protein [Sinanaerobacter chloroacetimidivorans]MBR0599965.1 flavodoxin family protein [Sinanaerobacter chloroacetimidivorans]